MRENQKTQYHQLRKALKTLKRQLDYNKIKGIIFDFDGTLVTLSIPFQSIKDSIIREAKKRNLKFRKDLPILELLDYIRKKNKKKGREFYILGNKILKEAEIKASNKTKPGKNVIITLKNLKENGIKIGIITRNCKDSVLSVIKRFSIPYDILLTREDVEKVKPHKSHLEKCINLLGLKKEEIILVGDHPLDIRCGKKAGVISIGIKTYINDENLFYKEKADFVIDEIEDIEYLIGLKCFKPGKLPNRFLKYLLKKYTDTDESILQGAKVGCDCAIFKTNKKILFAKTDPITLTSKDIGFYLVNINVNDIVVMGGLPKYFLCTLLLPENIKFPEIEEIFIQISNECKKLNIKWIGGHTEILFGIKNPIAVGLTIGENLKKINSQIIKPGDFVFLLKPIGIEGASILAREKYEELKNYFSEEYLNKVKNSIKKPGISIFKEAILLWKNLNIKLMHDPTEGGISTGLYEMSENKNIGILIDLKSLFFYPPVLKFCKIFELNPLGIISSGCIIGIIGKKEKEKFLKICKKNKMKGEIIGIVIEEKGVYFKKNSKKFQFPKFSRDEINKIF